MLRDLQAAILKPAIGAWLRSAGAAWRHYPRPTDELTIDAAGPNPRRVLLLGGGMAVGYGVATYQLSLGGYLARKLAALTGRGAQVSIAADVRMTARMVSEVVTEHRVADYDAVVVAVGGNDAFTLAKTRTWERHMSDFFTNIESQDTISPPHIYVAGIPPISSITEVPKWAAAPIKERVLRLNECTSKLAALSPSRSFIPLTSNGLLLTSISQPKPYSHWAEEIATVMAATLES